MLTAVSTAYIKLWLTISHSLSYTNVVAQMSNQQYEPVEKYFRLDGFDKVCVAICMAACGDRKIARRWHTNFKTAA